MLDDLQSKSDLIVYSLPVTALVNVVAPIGMYLHVVQFRRSQCLIFPVVFSGSVRRKLAIVLCCIWAVVATGNLALTIMSLMFGGFLYATNGACTWRNTWDI